MILGKPLFNSFHIAITNLTITIHIILNTAYRIQTRMPTEHTITLDDPNCQNHLSLKREKPLKHQESLSNHNYSKIPISQYQLLTLHSLKQDKPLIKTPTIVFSPLLLSTTENTIFIVLDTKNISQEPVQSKRHFLKLIPNQSTQFQKTPYKHYPLLQPQLKKNKYKTQTTISLTLTTTQHQYTPTTKTLSTNTDFQNQTSCSHRQITRLFTNNSFVSNQCFNRTKDNRQGIRNLFHTNNLLDITTLLRTPKPLQRGPPTSPSRNWYDVCSTVAHSSLYYK